MLHTRDMHHFELMFFASVENLMKYMIVDLLEWIRYIFMTVYRLCIYICMEREKRSCIFASICINNTMLVLTLLYINVFVNTSIQYYLQSHLESLMLLFTSEFDTKNIFFLY